MVEGCEVYVRYFSSMLLACAHRSDPNTLVIIIESSPTNLDPRVGWMPNRSASTDCSSTTFSLATNTVGETGPGGALGDSRSKTYIFHLPRREFCDGVR